MKKLLIILAASLMLFASCTAYTCPTYTSKPAEKEAEKVRHENKM